MWVVFKRRDYQLVENSESLTRGSYCWVRGKTRGVVNGSDLIIETSDVLLHGGSSFSDMILSTDA